MKILHISVWTRWDMEPFLAIGKILQRKWHEIACAFPEQFEDLVLSEWFQFFSLWPDFLDLIQDQKWKEFIGWEVWFFRRLKAIDWFLKRYNHINEKQILLQKESIDMFHPDRIVFHSLASYPVIWSKHNTGKCILLSTVPYLLHPTNNYSHIILNKNLGSFLNKLSFPIMNYLLTAPIMWAVKNLDIMEGITRKQMSSSLLKGKTIYTVSQTLFQTPDYWPKNAQVVWFPQRDKKGNFVVKPELSNFLEKHNKILFLTFGSMTNAFSKQKTDLILKVLEKNKISAIINTFAWWLEEPLSYNKDMFYFTESIPYDYIFPKVYAIVHHGWAGTTHMSLLYWKPNLIIPHILDQFFWNTKNHALWAWPKWVRIAKLTTQIFEQKIIDLWTNKSYKVATQKLAKSMSSEDYQEKIYQMIVEG